MVSFIFVACVWLLVLLFVVGGLLLTFFTAKNSGTVGGALCGVAVISVAGIMGALTYNTFHVKHDTFPPLRKDQWVCSQSHPYTTYVKSGAAMIPVTSNICVQYTKML